MSEHEPEAGGMVQTTLNGRQVEVQRDRWCLGVAREMGIFIPTLCHHPALEPYGACRLCVVEVTRGRWSWLTTSCDLPIREGLSIRTDTPAVQKARRITLELLWAEAPQSEELRDLARRMGMEKPRFAFREGENRCILCGLCVRVCERVLGQAAVSFSFRGTKRQVGPPFSEPSEVCIGCNACVAVCPTGHVRSRDEGLYRRMETWRTDLELAECQVCGRRFAPVRLLERVREVVALHVPLERVCLACRRARTAARLLEISKHSDKTVVVGARSCDGPGSRS